MAMKFSELLDKQRLRPLWRQSTQDATTKASAAEQSLDDPNAAEASTDLGGPQIPVEPPHRVLAELEQTLAGQLGASSMLLANLLHPLRAAITKVDPSAAARVAHPLQKAASGRIPDLIDRLDDALTGLTTK